MYANVVKTKVFFIAMPSANHPGGYRAGTILAGLDESGRKPKWSLPYAAFNELGQVGQAGLFSAAIQGVRKQCGIGLEFSTLCEKTCTLAVDPSSGEMISSPKKNQHIELQMFMVVSLNKGTPNSRNGFFQGVDFYDLDSSRSDVRKHMLPGSQNSALDGFRNMKDRSWPFTEATKLNLDTLGIRLESLAVRPSLVDSLTGKKQSAAGKRQNIAA
jgi:hypothetical protein